MRRRINHQPLAGKAPQSPYGPRGKPSSGIASRHVGGDDRWRAVVACLLLTLAVWLVFGQTLGHEFVNVDDDIYVTDNPHVASGWTSNGIGWAFQNLQAGFWHPLTWLSLMTDAQLYGAWPGGFHLTNVVLHLANTVLLFSVFRRLTALNWPSAFIAALFAVHPLHIESVAWISERKDVLSTMFFLLSLWAYVRYAKAEVHSPKFKAQKSSNAQDSVRGMHLWRVGDSPLPRSFTFGLWVLSLFFFAFSLMSKTMVVTLPLVMLLLDYWPLRRLQRSTILRLVLEKVPFFVLALAAGWLTIHAEKSIGALSHGGATPLTHRIANAVLSLVWYLSRTVWPADLAVFYPFPDSFPIESVLGSALLSAAISVAVLWLGRRHSYLLVGWFWYLITLSPVSGLIPVGAHARADRYTYIPLIGVFLMVTWGVLELCGRWRHRRVWLWTTSITVFAGLLVAARVQTAHWRDSITLWSRVFACTPEHFVTLNNLGNALAAKGRTDEAVLRYERALQLNPGSARVHNNLGNKFAARGEWDAAILHFERAIASDPGFPNAYYNLGLVLAMQRKPDEAIAHYERALQLRPDYIEARNNLGNALAAQGKFTDAVAQYTQVLQLKPGFAETRYNLGNMLLKLGKLAEAVQQYERAIQLKPDFLEAHNNLAIALANQGRLADAIQHFQRAMNLATTRGKTAVVEEIRKRMESYGISTSQPKPQ